MNFNEAWTQFKQRDLLNRVKTIRVSVFNLQEYTLISQLCHDSKGEIRVLLRHPIFGNKSQFLRNLIRTNVGLLLRHTNRLGRVKIRGYARDPVFKGFLLDQRSGFYSIYTITQSRRKRREYRGHDQIGVLLDAAKRGVESRLLAQYSEWFENMWRGLSLPMFPRPPIIFVLNEMIVRVASPTNVCRTLGELRECGYRVFAILYKLHKSLETQIDRGGLERGKEYFVAFDRGKLTATLRSLVAKNAVTLGDAIMVGTNVFEQDMAAECGMAFIQVKFGENRQLNTEFWVKDLEGVRDLLAPMRVYHRS